MSSPQWRPTPDAVAAHVSRRLVGVPGGTFGADTQPTRDAVESIIGGVVGDVVAELGGDAVPAHLEDAARDVVAIGAASYVEQSLNPEQQYGDGSAGQTLERRYLARLNRLVAAVHHHGQGALGSVQAVGATRARLEGL